eukprot:5165365-Prymnesium_polylepis.1
MTVFHGGFSLHELRGRLSDMAAPLPLPAAPVPAEDVPADDEELVISCRVMDPALTPPDCAYQRTIVAARRGRVAELDIQ